MGKAQGTVSRDNTREIQSNEYYGAQRFDRGAPRSGLFGQVPIGNFEAMKPMFVTIIPFLFLFTWLRGVYVPVLGGGWIWYYLGYSVLASVIMRKVLKVA